MAPNPASSPAAVVKRHWRSSIGHMHVIVHRYELDHLEQERDEAFAEVAKLAAENTRLREALRTIGDGCVDWSNDDVRDQCRAALDA